MIDFILAALPWIILGLTVAILAVSTNRRKKDSTSSVSEDPTAQEAEPSSPTDAHNAKQTSEAEGSLSMYMSLGMCLGVGIGAAFSSRFDNALSYGICFGMLGGVLFYNLRQKKD